MNYAELTKEFDNGTLLCVCGCDEIIKEKKELVVSTGDGKELLAYKAKHYFRKLAK